MTATRPETRAQNPQPCLTRGSMSWRSRGLRETFGIPSPPRGQVEHAGLRPELFLPPERLLGAEGLPEADHLDPVREEVLVRVPKVDRLHGAAFHPGDLLWGRSEEH